VRIVAGIYDLRDQILGGGGVDGVVQSDDTNCRFRNQEGKEKADDKRGDNPPQAAEFLLVQF